MSGAVSAQILARVKEYAWMLPVASPIAFIMAWGMGANELSSNWGNVFGSRVLKLWQIVLLAAAFEFTGAMALGSGVASTIRGSILSSSRYANAPEQLMFGFLCVLVTCSVWLIIANIYGLPVSDSQTTVGVGLASRGWDSIRWDPGMRNIGITWVSSPFSAGVLSALFFSIVKYFILKHENATLRAKRFFPLFTPAIEDNLEAWMKVAIAAAGSLLFTLIAQFTYFRWVSQKMDEVDAAAEVSSVEAQVVPVKGENEDNIVESTDEKDFKIEDNTPRSSPGNKVTGVLVTDHQGNALAADSQLTNVHTSADQYPAGVELLFTHLLIVTACLKSFAHGASDVSNATGPLAAILNILDDGRIDSQSKIPLWTLAIGACGMAIGIITYGYKTLTTLAVKVTRISPVRGVCIDAAGAIVIIVCTYLKIPVSSTQVTVGAIIGAGLVNGSLLKDRIHWGNLLIIVVGWLVTLVFSAAMSFSVYSFGAKAPKA
ncbi:phosphate transporter [Chytridium lagenaria]|nr:phosphate transporter [Chytridium lagenaria]